MRDQLAICHFFAKKTAFEKEKSLNTGSDAKRKASPSNGASNAKKNNKTHLVDNGYDEMFEETNELFYTDKDELSADSKDSTGDYLTEQAYHNDTESSISITERSSKFLQNIYIELLRIIKPLEKKGSYAKPQRKPSDSNIDLAFMMSRVETLEDELDEDLLMQEGAQHGGKKGPVRPEADMRHILGFLNQSEWILSLNIGNIMQITPVQLEDLASVRRNEQELDRFAFLETVSFLCVGYFCVSTEIRFIIQLKEEIGAFKQFDVGVKTEESENWHTKSLEVACSFLPSDCPLLNHILLSYQKHHAPSQSTIPENTNTNEYLRVVKPITGIDNCRFRPIVRAIPHSTINLSPIRIKLAKITVQKMISEIQPRSQLAININQGG